MVTVIVLSVDEPSEKENLLFDWRIGEIIKALEVEKKETEKSRKEQCLFSAKR